MGLITTEIEVGISATNRKQYEALGYKIPMKLNKENKLVNHNGVKILVKIEDLTKGSGARVSIIYDGCGKLLDKVTYQRYLSSRKENGEYYCQKCASNLYGHANAMESKLNSCQSFYDWCSEHDRLDVILRWDYLKNSNIPENVNYNTTTKYWFTCERGIHESELKTINSFTKGQEGSIQCKKCNSIAQYLIDKYGENALKLYWDYSINDVLNIDPWKLTKACSNPKVAIICQKDASHGSYMITCGKFTSNRRCPECYRSLNEELVELWLIKNNVKYETQKEFEGLVGTGGGLLSYDFYLEKINLIIEVQGEFHDGTAYQQTEEKFLKQEIHDKRKKQYCLDNNITFMEIWYYQNVESILSNYFLKLNTLPTQEAI